VISRTLDRIPGVRCYDELLNTLRRSDEFTDSESYLAFDGKTSGRWRRQLMPARSKLRYLESTLKGTADVQQAVGFKLMDNHLTLRSTWNRVLYWSPSAMSRLRSPALKAWLLHNDVRVLHCVRENVLNLLVSNIRARETGIYHAVTTPDQTKVSIPTLLLYQRITQLSKGQRAAASYFEELEHLTIRYEDPWESKMTSIGELLGIKGLEAAAPSLVKVGADLSHSVRNYEEVCAILQNTEHAWMLGEQSAS